MLFNPIRGLVMRSVMKKIEIAEKEFDAGAKRIEAERKAEVRKANSEAFMKREKLAFDLVDGILNKIVS